MGGIGSHYLTGINRISVGEDWKSSGDGWCVNVLSAHRTVHVKKVNLTLCMFYHNKKSAIKFWDNGHLYDFFIQQHFKLFYLFKIH